MKKANGLVLWNFKKNLFKKINYNPWVYKNIVSIPLYKENVRT